MTDTTKGRARAHGAGLQLYFEQEFAQDSRNPFDGDEQYRAQVVGDAIVLWPAQLGRDPPVDGLGGE